MSPRKRDEKDFAFGFGIFFGVNFTLFIALVSCYHHVEFSEYLSYLAERNWMRRYESDSGERTLLSDFMGANRGDSSDDGDSNSGNLREAEMSPPSRILIPSIDSDPSDDEVVTI